MSTLNEIAREFGDACRRTYGAEMSLDQQRVLGLLQACRSGRLGHYEWGCQECHRRHFTPRTCGNRHCPSCQPGRAQEWLAQQVEKLLPVPYFLVTFTLPHSLHPLIRRHPREVYEALFQAAWGALQAAMALPRFGGLADIGMTAVLHTWGRDLRRHVHLHAMVPAGGRRPDGSWWAASPDYLVCVKVLSKFFRGKFRDALRKAGLLDQVPSKVWREAFTTDARPNDSGAFGLRYMARYVSRTAISNHRIVSCLNGQVTYTYTPSKTKTQKRRTLPAAKFLKLFLQHVVPKGLARVRHYGLLHAGAEQRRESVREQVATRGEPAVIERFERSRQVVINTCRREMSASVPCCPDCGSPLLLIDVTYRRDPLGRDDHLVFSELVYDNTS